MRPLSIEFADIATWVYLGYALVVWPCCFSYCAASRGEESGTTFVFRTLALYLASVSLEN